MRFIPGCNCCVSSCLKYQNNFNTDGDFAGFTVHSGTAVHDFFGGTVRIDANNTVISYPGYSSMTAPMVHLTFNGNDPENPVDIAGQRLRLYAAFLDPDNCFVLEIQYATYYGLIRLIERIGGVETILREDKNSVFTASDVPATTSQDEIFDIWFWAEPDRLGYQLKWRDYANRWQWGLVDKVTANPGATLGFGSPLVQAEVMRVSEFDAGVFLGGEPENLCPEFPCLFMLEQFNSYIAPAATVGIPQCDTWGDVTDWQFGFVGEGLNGTTIGGMIFEHEHPLGLPSGTATFELPAFPSDSFGQFRLLCNFVDEDNYHSFEIDSIANVNRWIKRTAGVDAVIDTFPTANRVGTWNLSWHGTSLRAQLAGRILNSTTTLHANGTKIAVSIDGANSQLYLAFAEFGQHPNDTGGTCPLAAGDGGIAGPIP